MPPDSSPATVTPATRTTRDMGRAIWTVAHRIHPAVVHFDRGDGRCTFEFHNSPKLTELWAAFDRHEARGDFRDFFESHRVVRSMMAKARQDGAK